MTNPHRRHRGCDCEAPSCPRELQRTLASILRALAYSMDADERAGCRGFTLRFLRKALVALRLIKRLSSKAFLGLVEAMEEVERDRDNDNIKKWIDDNVREELSRLSDACLVLKLRVSAIDNYARFIHVAVPDLRFSLDSDIYHQRVLKTILARCKEQGIWLENNNVTLAETRLIRRIHLDSHLKEAINQDADTLATLKGTIYAIKCVNSLLLSLLFKGLVVHGRQSYANLHAMDVIQGASFSSSGLKAAIAAFQGRMMDGEVGKKRVFTEEVRKVRKLVGEISSDVEGGVGDGFSEKVEKLNEFVVNMKAGSEDVARHIDGLLDDILETKNKLFGSRGYGKGDI